MPCTAAAFRRASISTCAKTTELQRVPDETGRATLAAVNAAAQKYAAPGKATLLLIGDYSKIGPGLRELGLGEITILDAEGKPARR